VMYQFPFIANIKDVLPAIKGKSEFFVAEREHFDVINYTVNMPDTFPEVVDDNTAILRECRGIKFHKNGAIAARTLHKFFNVGERQETAVDRICLKTEHNFLEKLDGSMIHPVRVGDEYHLCTKMGRTEIALMAEEHIKDKPNYVAFLDFCHQFHYTPTFEFCSRKNRVVLDYPEDRLVLTAMRHLYYGAYVTYNTMRSNARHFIIPVIAAFRMMNSNSIEPIVSHIRQKTGQEGVVLRYDNGHMLKIKCDEYVLIHKAKDSMTHEKNILEIIVTGKLDDLLAVLPPDDKKRVETYAGGFARQVKCVANLIRIQHNNLKRFHGVDRKGYALDVTGKKCRAMSSFVLPAAEKIMFALFDRQPGEPTEADITKMVLDRISKSLKSQATVDRVRDLFDDGNTKWSYVDVSVL
jgi:RNA ligase